MNLEVPKRCNGCCYRRTCNHEEQQCCYLVGNTCIINEKPWINLKKIKYY